MHPGREAISSKNKRQSALPHFVRVLLKGVWVPVLSVAVSLAVGALLIASIGVSPIAAYRELLRGAFGSAYAIGDTVAKSTPLIFTGLSVAFGRRCGLLNIGAEGQLYMGSLGATLAALWLPGSPKIVVIPFAIALGFILGGIWGAIPGYLKAKMGISEIITTIMFNYIAMYFVSYMVSGPIQDPSGFYPQSPELSLGARFPILLKGTRLHAGFLLALLCAYLMYLIIWRKTIGYEIRAVGLNKTAAHYGGINVTNRMVTAMFLAGGMGGLAGVNEILGVQHRLIEFFSPGLGFNGIAVALLGQSTPVGVILSSFLFGALRTGANVMQRSLGVHFTIISIIQGLVVLFVVSAYNLHHLKKWASEWSSFMKRLKPKARVGEGEPLDV
jgi:ABC-type uncharacterized transport system permease subunit